MRARSVSELAVETRALSKCFGRKVSLNRLDLGLVRGQIHAIVGSNGAGKSTLFRLLIGILTPSSGSSEVLGEDSQHLSPDARGRIGLVNEEHTLPGWLKVSQFHAMQRSLYPRWNERIYRDVVGQFQLLDSQRISELSRGERAGLNLAASMAETPELLILDEPTLGLDVVAQQAFLEAVLRSHEQAEMTIIYCSHQMDEVERLADNLIILDRGELRTMEAPSEFSRRVRCWVTEFDDQPPELQSIPGLLDAKGLDGLHQLVVLDRGERFAEELHALGGSNSHSVPIGLDRAVNAFLSRGHAGSATWEG